jgi:hypothetical protein
MSRNAVRRTTSAGRRELRDPHFTPSQETPERARQEASCAFVWEHGLGPVAALCSVRPDMSRG